MTQTRIIEQSQRYPTQAEIQAGIEHAHELRAQAIRSAFGLLAQIFAAKKDEAPARLPQPVRTAHC